MKMDAMALLNAVFNTISDGILLVDREDRVIFSNKRFGKLWKIPPEIVSSDDDQLLLQFISDQLLDPDTFIARVRALYQDSVTESFDEIAFKDGRIFERTSRPLLIDGAWQGRIWSFRDVSSERQGKVLFSAVTDLSPDIISLISPDGELTFNSRAAERIHGYAPEELIGKRIYDLIHPDERGAVETVLSKLRATDGSLARVRYRFRHKDFSYSWMEATAVNQLQNPLVRSLVVISREIGQQKELEDSLNQALKLRDDFISITSHELKTPLTSIKLQLQMLLRSGQSSAPPSPPKHQNITVLLDQVNALQRLIDDLLSVTRMRTGKLDVDRQREDLGQLVRSHLRSYEALFRDAQCDLIVDLDLDAPVFCDRYRIEQVLHNLYSNAMKYSPARQVTIRLEKREDSVILSVSDQGPGIPTEKQESIFKLFERGAHAPNVRGLGIGLFISRTIVEEHQGQLLLESTTGSGATFKVVLPIA